MIFRFQIIFFFILSLKLALSDNFTSHGDGYDIFHAFERGGHNALMASPLKWVSYFERQIIELDRVSSVDLHTSTKEYAQNMYKEMLISNILGLQFGKYELSFTPKVGSKVHAQPFNIGEREKGRDFPGFGVSMTGRTRLDNAENLLLSIFKDKIPGDVMETGVWRGGMSLFMRGIILMHNEQSRMSFVCDSFGGLPPSTYNLDQTIKWDHTPILEVSTDKVREIFEVRGIHDPNIIFVKGFFSATMPPLRQLVKDSRKFSLLRLDGDMYESTVDVLYNFYDLLSVGGYVIIDDYARTFPARWAVDDFFRVHGMTETRIELPDGIGGYWRKEQEIQVQYWRYETKTWTGEKK